MDSGVRAEDTRVACVRATSRMRRERQRSVTIIWVLHPDSWRPSFASREDAPDRRDVGIQGAFAFRTPSVGSAGQWVAHALRTSR